MLPAVATREGKAVVRNWLACGAPLVSSSMLPEWALPTMNPPTDAGSSATPDFHQLWTDVFRPKCATSGCHDASGSGGLSMPDECTAYVHLKQSGSCMKPRVVAGEASSLLLEKLTSDPPACGGSMPPGASLSLSMLERVRTWVSSGAAASGCP